MTQFTYQTTTVTMETDPLHPRDWGEEQEFASGYDSSGTAYAYDCGAPIFRTEDLSFPAISLTNLTSLFSFIQMTILGSYKLFTWLDRQGVIRTARYKNMTWQQVSNQYWQVSLTIEVQQ